MLISSFLLHIDWKSRVLYFFFLFLLVIDDRFIGHHVSPFFL